MRREFETPVFSILKLRSSVREIASFRVIIVIDGDKNREEYFGENFVKTLKYSLSAVLIAFLSWGCFIRSFSDTSVPVLSAYLTRIAFRATTTDGSSLERPSPIPCQYSTL